MSTFESNLDYTKLRDVNSSRAKFATIIPSTNTTVEYDFHDIRPGGITFPVGRMYIPEPQTADDAEFTNMIDQVNNSLEQAIKVVMTTRPDYLILAMSAPTFWGGIEGNEKMETRMKEISGLQGVTSGSSAVRDALTTLGAKNIAFLTPYQQVGDDQVERFFNEAGFNVKRSIGLKVPSIDMISATPKATLMDALRALDGDDVDVLVQAGTNLSMVRLADEAERWLGKPVVTINSASLWHALRHFGIQDKFEGFGSLLRDY